MLIHEIKRKGMVMGMTSFMLFQGLFWLWMAEWAFNGKDRDDDASPVARTFVDLYEGTGTETATAAPALEQGGAEKPLPLELPSSGEDSGITGGVVRVLAGIGESMGPWLPYVKAHEQAILYSVIACGGFVLATIAPRQLVSRLELHNKGQTLRVQTYEIFGLKRVQDVPIDKCRRLGTATGFEGHVLYKHAGEVLPYAVERNGFHKGGQRVFDAFVKQK